MPTKEILREQQALSLDIKIMKTKQRIKEFFMDCDGEPCVSFSGGKDSTVLLHIVRRMYPDCKAIFSDTGLEYPEVRQFVNSFPNVEIIKPKMAFPDVVKSYGYPVVGKELSKKVYYARKGSKWH